VITKNTRFIERPATRSGEDLGLEIYMAPASIISGRWKPELLPYPIEPSDDQLLVGLTALGCAFRTSKS
jgi:hypothetical protein